SVYISYKAVKSPVLDKSRPRNTSLPYLLIGSASHALHSLIGRNEFSAPCIQMLKFFTFRPNKSFLATDSLNLSLKFLIKVPFISLTPSNGLLFIHFDSSYISSSLSCSYTSTK